VDASGESSSSSSHRLSLINQQMRVHDARVHDAVTVNYSGAGEHYRTGTGSTIACHVTLSGGRDDAHVGDDDDDVYV